MADKTARLLRSMRRKGEVRTPIATEMYLPNTSGNVRSLVDKDINVNSITTNTLITNSPVEVEGPVAHSEIDANKPVKIGFKVIEPGETITQTSGGDVADCVGTSRGSLYVLGGEPNINSVEYEFTTAQTNNKLVTVSAGTHIVVTMADVTMDDANTAAIGIRLGFAASALTAVSSSGVADMVLSHKGIPPGSGMVKGNGGAQIAQGNDGHDLMITCENPSSGIRLLINYFLTTA